jgi:hypothetical protein
VEVGAAVTDIEMAPSGELTLAARVEAHLEAIAQAMLCALVEQVPPYAQLPVEELQGEILDICRQNLRIFLASLADAQSPTDAQLGDILASAMRRAEERVPLEAVLRAYHVGLLVAWRFIQGVAGPDDASELLTIATSSMRYMERVTSIVSGAYLRERELISGEEHDLRHAVADALLTGAPADELAQRAQIALADAYFVLAMHVDRSPDEQEAIETSRVATRRKMRRLQQQITLALGHDALCVLDPNGGVLLVPAETGPAGLVPLATRAGPPEDTWHARLGSELTAAAQAAVTLGVAEAHHRQDIAAATTQATELVRLARELGRPPGSYLLDDLLLEYACTRDPAVLARLESLLAPAADKPFFLDTVRTYLAVDSDRRRAAALLHLHPNTLNYRIRRVHELTGLDVTTTKGLALLAAALLARQLAAANHAARPAGDAMRFEEER